MGAIVEEKNVTFLDNNEYDNQDIKDAYESLPSDVKTLVEKYAVSDTCVYPTKFVGLNILTGRNVRDDNGKLLYKVRGLREAAWFLFVGKQSSGKTTKANNIAGHIKSYCDTLARQQKAKCRTEIHELNPEMGMERVSVLRNCGLSEDNVSAGEFFMPEGYDVTTEFLVEYVTNIAKRKLANPEHYSITCQTSSNKYKKTFIPTIVVLDSWNATCPKELRDISKNNNMYDAQKIKENNKMISMIYPLCKQANIMMFIVCQMSDKIQTGFDFKPSDYQALQQDAKINGGRVLQYLVDGIMYSRKVTDKSTGSSSRKSVEEILGVDDPNIGFATEWLMLKNRFGDSSEKSTYKLVMDNAVGFNPIYSYFYDVLKSDTILKTTGGRKSLEGYDKTFYGKELQRLCMEDASFLQALNNKMESEYAWSLEASNNTKTKLKEINDFMNQLFAL